MRRLTVLIVVLSACSLPRGAEIPGGKTFTNSLGMKMVRIERGHFLMGSEDGEWDERPVHEVTISKPFYLGVTEVTNAQYEQFDPEHRKSRGKLGYSREDDEAVVFVSWEDAVAFCKWLSQKESRPYRLPTEAEWEYACRAGTTTRFHTGLALPDGYAKHFIEGRRQLPSPDLRVARTAPNTWGVYDLHGNVEEWCMDWYGPYPSAEQTDPVGCKQGDFRVVRGGSHSTEVRFLRSANRMGALADDRHWLIGLRVVVGEAPKSPPLPVSEPRLWARNVQQEPCDWSEGPDLAKPYFAGPLRYVKIPHASNGPMFSAHNHDPGLAWCPNGDLLAIWYSCKTEKGRELCILASRFRWGAKEWEPASPFWDAPDRNDHAPALWHDGQGTLYYFNGLSVGPAYRENLALIMRISRDNGASWSKARLINPERGLGSQPVTTVFRAQNGSVVLPVDAPWRMEGGATALWVSPDNGRTWSVSEGTIRGIHGGVTQLKDGRLFALGRYKSPIVNDPLRGEFMPKSLSSDMGKTWKYSDSEFPPISGGQRLVLMRLREGPIVLVSFTDFRPAALKQKRPKGLLIRDASGKQRRVYGMYAALSFDEGRSWPLRKLITAGGPPRKLNGGAHTDLFTMDSTHAEPAGYLAATQTPDGVIHLISSALHYSFNLAWLRTPMPAPDR
ncbi:MAG: SUMF1/EgtB/PvdO family nonheme iron enzyme [Phycisphaerales bacterium]|nr:MAG: SUMF1/EgtB/PvdO family nonheme iron enzyme [Phycisphaerales bacterium]